MKRKEFTTRLFELINDRNAKRANAIANSKNTLADVQSAYESHVQALEAMYCEQLGFPVGSSVRVKWEAYTTYKRDHDASFTPPTMGNLTYTVGGVAPTGFIRLANVSDDYNFIPPKFLEAVTHDE